MSSPSAVTSSMATTPTSGEEPASGARPRSEAGAVTSIQSVPAATRATRAAASISTPRISCVLTRIVSARVSKAPALWPVPCAVTRSPRSLANSTIAMTSSVECGMATAAGRWSMATFQAWRASSQSRSPGAETRPDMRSRRAVGSMPGGSVMSMRPCSAPRPPSASGTSLVPAREPLDGLLRLGGVEQVDAGERLALHRRRQQVAEALVEHPLRPRDGRGGGGVEGGGELRDGGVEAVGRDERVEEAVAVHPARVLERAREQQLAGRALPEHLGQQQRAGVGGAEADAHLGGREAGALGPD